MIAFGIMMWFVSFLICIVAISLSKGNVEIVHGKTFNRVDNKIGYSKELAGPCFLISFGLCLGGITAVLIPNNMAIIYAVIVILFFVISAGILFVMINRKYTTS